MRAATIQRTSLSNRNLRFDPSFYVRTHRLQNLFDSKEELIPLRDLLSEMHDGARLRSTDSGIPMVRLSDLHPCELEIENLSQVRVEDGKKWPHLRPGDVIFTRAAVPFRAAVVSENAPTPMTISPEITLLRPHPAILPEYLAAVLSTAAFEKILKDLAYRKGPTALRRIRLNDIAKLPIPLPRKSIQEKIREAYLNASKLTAKATSEIQQIIKAIYAEVEDRIQPVPAVHNQFVVSRANLNQRWDISYAKCTQLTDALKKNSVMKPLFNLARPQSSSLKGYDKDDTVLAVQADSVNESTFLVETFTKRKFGKLSKRMRQPLLIGDVILCTTGSGGQVAYLGEGLNATGLPLLGSATFTALCFNVTPMYYAVSLAHPLVRLQLNLISSGNFQRFVNKRDLDQLLVPSLSIVWREDFDARIERAQQRRREALIARDHLLEIAENFVREE